MSLRAIGVSAEAEQIYRYFLAHRGNDVGSVRQVLRFDPDSIEAALETLSDLRLLDISDRHKIVATEPQAGVERLIEERLHQLNSEIRLALQARDAIPGLVDEHRKGVSASNALDIERVEGIDRVRQRLDDLSFFSHYEMLTLNPGKPLSPEAIEAARPLSIRSLRRGITVQSVYNARVFEDQRTLRYICDLVNLGEQVHVTKEPMDRMVIFDRSVAVVPIDPQVSAQGALLVREPGLVSQLVTYFSGVWQSTDEPPELREPAEETPSLSDLERRVLAALATSDKDEIAAREIDVSVRTYRRYVADLMARLGAVNRFQAALRAKEESWI